MSTVLAAQLAQIAANSRSSLDVKAQKAAHSKSLIFEPRIAASQNLQTLYTICYEGFEDLCSLDSRFLPFNTTLFSEQSQNEDRTQMTAAENADLDSKVESFLQLVGSRIRLMPAIKAIEWLIRRFRIHEQNTSVLISTFLPYHTIPAFKTLLSILPAQLPPLYRFLQPYAQSLTQPPRSVLVHQAIHDSNFFTAISTYTLDVCSARKHYPALVSFWGTLMTEAVNGKLDKSRSGRRAIQEDRNQALLHEIGPILSNSLVMGKAPDLQVASYMVLSVFVAKGNLSDDAIGAFMEQLVTGWSSDSLRPGLVCLCILAQYRSPKQMSSKITKALLKVQGLPQLLSEIGKQHEIGKLANGLSLALIQRIVKKGDIRGLPLVESLLARQVLSEPQTTVAFKSLLLAAHRVDDDVDAGGNVRKALASTIVNLSQTETSARDLFLKAIDDTDVDIDALEMRLDAQIRPTMIAAPVEEDVEMNGHENEPSTSQDLDLALKRIKESGKAPTTSCLTATPNDFFTDLCSVFLASVSSTPGIGPLDKVGATGEDAALENPYYLTFCMRIWCGPYPALARVGALDLAKERLKKCETGSPDLQALIPYCLTALNDPSKKVRRAAADLVTVLAKASSQTGPKSEQRWAEKALYDPMNSFPWMDSDVAGKFIRNVLLPTMEECVLNADHVLQVTQMSLNSSSKALSEGGSKDKSAHLSHGARLAILTCLAGHTIHTPLLTVKSRLLNCLNQVKGVSGVTRTQLLLPLLSWWASLSTEAARQYCERERIDEITMDQQAVDVILPNDQTGLDYILEVFKTGSQLRERILSALFSRIERLWPSMKSESQSVIAQHLLDLAKQDWSEDRSALTREAGSLLENIQLSTDILLVFLESLHPATKMATEPSPGKRRRTSSSGAHRGVGTQATPEMAATLKQVTFVLQLVEGSDPAKHPQLLDALFNSLSELQTFRALVGSELGYLQNLVLRSLLAMIPAYKDTKNFKIDGSGGYGDLLVNCIQKSSSPAVQNSALLLIANLANVAPELVLHSVMPIFTFMGSSVLRQSDDYSAHIINQTVKEVVPPLIQSLRKGKKDPVLAVSGLLLSFVTAYEHIPSHRRIGLFVSLVETLGADEFLFAVLAMLADKYGAMDQVLHFCTDLFNYFKVETQLQSLINVIALTKDLFETKPVRSIGLLGTFHEVLEVQKIALREMNLLHALLSSRKLTTQIGKLGDRDDMEASKVRELYSILLKDLLQIAGQGEIKSDPPLHSRCGDALSKLLNLQSVGEFIKSVETLLDQPDDVLRHKVLRAVHLRIDREKNTADASARSALLAFLPQLTAIIRTSDDLLYKELAVECVDEIAQNYGKKDPEAVTAAASTISGDQCLGKEDGRLRINALLCLASLVDVLQDGIVPVLPSAIPKALSYMAETIEAETRNVALHNASYAFMTSLAQYLPYMLSGAYLQQLLAISSLSASRSLNSDANNERLQCLQFLAKQIDAKPMFGALEKNWDKASAAGFNATREYLNILGLTIDRHPRPTIEKNSGSLSTIIVNALDTRRNEHVKSQKSGGTVAVKAIAELEETVNSVALRMIYKLNDAAFRPIFTRMIDWASSGLPKKDSTGKALRLVSIFGFLLSFFEALKSIVTSYATYVIEPAVEALKTVDPSEDQGRELWQKVLQTLAKSFEHDQDDFWQAPAHFDAVESVLTAQFLHAASVDLNQDLIPAVVELANAADSQEHQKQLNSALLKHLRSEQSEVRLASVKCEQALTTKLGEEWLSMLPEMLPYISELQDDDDEDVERETHRWIVGIEGVLGESLDAMLQ